MVLAAAIAYGLGQSRRVASLQTLVLQLKAKQDAADSARIVDSVTTKQRLDLLEAAVGLMGNAPKTVSAAQAWQHNRETTVNRRLDRLEEHLLRLERQ